MTKDAARAEMAELQLAYDAHGELAEMHRTLNTTEALLMDDRSTEAEEMVRGAWGRCQAMRAAWLARPDSEYVAGVLESIEKAQDQANVWRDIVAEIPPGWAEWRRQREGISPMRGSQ